MMKTVFAVLLLVAGAFAETEVCNDCQVIARYVSAAAADPVQVTAMGGFLHRVCTRAFAGEAFDSCTNIANNMPHIVSSLDKLLTDPLTMCVETALCGEREYPVHEEVASAVHVIADMVEKSGKGGKLECDICELGVAFLDGWVNSQRLQTSVMKVLGGFCDKLGTKFVGKTCHDLVKMYIPKLFKVVGAMLANKKETCGRLKMCQDTVMQFKLENVFAEIGNGVAALDTEEGTTPAVIFMQAITKDARDKTGMMCTFCKIGFSGLLGYYDNDAKAVSTLAAGVSDVACNKVLPKGYQPDCVDFCGLYMDPVLQMTLKQVNPQMMCEMVMLCKKTKKPSN